MSFRHEKVLEALTICYENVMLNALPKEQHPDLALPVGPSRFDPIIVGLREGKESPQLRVACFQLINVLILVPEELDFRLHLRNEFTRAGLLHLFEVAVFDRSCASS